MSVIPAVVRGRGLIRTADMDQPLDIPSSGMGRREGRESEVGGDGRAGTQEINHYRYWLTIPENNKCTSVDNS